MSWAQPAASSRAKVGAPALALRVSKCTQCKGEMQAVSLEGHYGQQHEVDLCPGSEALAKLNASLR